MKTEIFKGNLTALSPIHHGGNETFGTTKLILALPTIIKNPDTGEEERDLIPFIHGNAIRGYLRRLIMADMFDLLDYKLESKKIYHFLFTGGMLEALDSKDKGAINLTLKKEIRDLLPPISLLGSAIGNQMIEGKLKVGNGEIVCSETKHYLEDFNDNTFGAYNLRDIDFGTRLDDLKGDTEETNDKKKKDEKEQHTQMMYEFEVLIRGTKFTHEFILHDCDEVEKACFVRMLNLWKERPYIGGKSGTGYGKVGIDYKELNKESDTTYLDFINDNKEKIINLIEELNKIWK